MILRRHDIVRVDPAAFEAERVGRPDLRGEPLLAGWARAWPLVARRRSASDRPDHVPLGLPLPPSQGKKRIALDLAPEAIVSMEPPPSLASIHETAPAAWRASIAALLRLSDRYAVEPRVFGAFAWERLTGLPYLHPASDLDLLWPLGAGIEAILAALPAIEAAAPGRLDGEIVRADGGGVQWRELASARAILVKRIDGVSLEARDDFLRDDQAASASR